jgi:hypothetical protein
MQSARFRELSELSIDDAIIILDGQQLTIFARNEKAERIITGEIEILKSMAWLTCGARVIQFITLEKTLFFSTGDIVEANSPSPLMISILDAPVAEKPDALEPKIEPTTQPIVDDLFTIDELAAIAQKAGFDPASIAAEIRALSPKGWRRGDLVLYQIDSLHRAIQSLAAEAIDKTRTIAAQGVPKVEAEVKVEKNPTANKPTAKKPSGKPPGRKVGTKNPRTPVES